MSSNWRAMSSYCVVVPISDPVLHAVDQLLVLQQHQVDIKQGSDFVRRILGQVLLQAQDFVHDSIAGDPDTRNLFNCFCSINKVVRHVGAT
jgi:hypothetical protein